MRRAPKNILFHELIGLRVKVIQYTDPTVVGVEGIIVDETQKTFIIEKSDGKRIRVFKENGVFELKIPGAGPVVVRGEKLFGRPWDRLKKVLTVRGWSA